MQNKTRHYTIDYFMNKPLITNTLIKGEPFRMEYRDGSDYSTENDKDYIAFINKRMETIIQLLLCSKWFCKFLFG